MALPLANTTVKVIRPSLAEDSNIDPWEREGEGDLIATQALVATGVRAVIAPSIGRTAEPGDTETVEFRLTADPVDLTFRDKVQDESTGKVYEVSWAHSSPGILGFNAHVSAGLVTVTGLGNE